jgi:hypothetical protein
MKHVLLSFRVLRGKRLLPLNLQTDPLTGAQHFGAPACILTRRGARRSRRRTSRAIMKLRPLFFSFVLLLVAASSAVAQGGPGRPDDSHHRGGPGQEYRRGGPNDGPVAKLLRHQTDLDLTDDQVRQLREIDRKMDEQNRPYVAQLLRIRKDMNVRPGVRPEDMTDAERAEFQSHMQEARPLWEQIRKNNRAAMHQVGDILDARQKAALREMLEKQRNPRERNGSPGPERSHDRRGN